MKFLYFFMSSSLLIGMVLLIRKVFRKKLAPGVIYALWLIPMIRLMVPFAGWNVPVFGTAADFLHAPYTLTKEFLENEKPLEGSKMLSSDRQGAEENDSHKQGTKIYTAVHPKKNTVISEGAVLPVSETEEGIGDGLEIWAVYIVWFVGSVLLGIYVIVQNHRLRKSVNSMEIAALADDLEVYVSDNAKVPCLMGVIRPKILVTRAVFEEPELYECVIKHELAHYHQRDHIWNVIRIVLCVVYWWNPLAWMAAKCVEEDAELACDASILKNYTVEERRAYGYALLQMLENTSDKNYHMCTATSMSGSKVSMKRRIHEISNRTMTKRYVLFPTILVLMLMLVIGCTMPSNRSWIQTGEWHSGDTGEELYFEGRYEYSLQENIKSQLIYCEIYQYGELLERKIMLYGDIEDFTEELIFRHEVLETSDERKLVLETDGIGIEMQNPLYGYSDGGERAFSALQSENLIEIVPEKSLILGMEYCALNPLGPHLSAVYMPKEPQIETKQIQTYDCRVLSDYSEEELKELFQKSYKEGIPYICVYRIIFSELSETELYAQYEAEEINVVEGKLSEKYTDYEQFVTAWAEAFADRDADTIAGMVTEGAYEQLKKRELLEGVEGYRSFGWSSPWPMWKEERYRILSCDDSGAEILYYADVSLPHITVWKETLKFADSEGELLVGEETLEFLDDIQSMEEYYEAYPEGKISGTMMDYSVNGMGAVLNQNALEQPNDGWYKGLFDAETAALELLNISRDEKAVSYAAEDTGGEATVQLHFLKEGKVVDTIELTMWQPYGEDGIWIPK